MGRVRARRSSSQVEHKWGEVEMSWCCAGVGRVVDESRMHALGWRGGNLGGEGA